MTKAQQSAQQEAIDRLRSLLAPGDTIFTILKHRASSGMFRVIDAVQLKDNEAYHLGYTVAQALGWRYDDRREGVRLSGCGMDMGFHLVYELSHALWPNGFTCTGQGCPSNDHTNGDRDYTPHHHTNGDYALRQRWL